MKDLGIIEVRHVPGDDNDADISTKNAVRAVFEKHIPKLTGKDEYMSDREVSWTSDARDRYRVRVCISSLSRFDWERIYSGRKPGVDL